MSQFLCIQYLDKWLAGVKSFLCGIHKIKLENKHLVSDSHPLYANELHGSTIADPSTTSLLCSFN